MANASAVAGTAQTPDGQTATRVDSLAFSLFFALGLTVMQRAIGLSRSILFCRLLTEEQLGQFSLITSFCCLAAPIAVLGLPGCFGRYVAHYRSRKELRSFLSKITGLTIVTSVGCLGGLACMPKTVSWMVFRTEEHVDLVVLFLPLIAAVVASNFCYELMESMRQVRLVSWMRFLASFSFAALGVGLVAFMSDAVVAVSVAFMVSCVLVCLPAAYYLSKHWESIGAENPNQVGYVSLWSKLAPFAAWLWVANLMHHLFETSDRYMLLHFSEVGAERAQALVGQFHSGRFIPMLLVGLATLLSGILMPYLSTHWEAGRREVVGQWIRLAIKLLTIGFTFISLVILACSPLLFDWVLQGRYNEGLSVLPITMAYCIWIGVAALAQDYLWVAEKGRLPSLALLIGLVTNVTANALLVPRFELVGAVVGTAIAHSAVLLLLYAFNVRNGWKADQGVVLLFFLPIVLCLPTWIAWLVTLLLAGAMWKTNLVLDPRERDELMTALSEGRHKLLSRFGR